jgi:hypothetical protein
MSTANIVSIPLYSDLSYTYGFALEGVALQFSFEWNSRTSKWYMDITTEDQTEIVQGIALIPQYKILGQYSMDAFGLSGYFLLMPNNLNQVSLLSSSSDVISESFQLFYIYVTD